MELDDGLEFDKEGMHYFVDSSHVWEADSYNYVSSAYVRKDDFKDRILHVEFKDGYLADFRSETIAGELDERLREVKGIEEVYWEDRELFQITYKEGQLIQELIKKIDAKITKLSKLEE